MKKIAVFKTDIKNNREAEIVTDAIQRQYPDSKPSIDLEDCDRVLRIERRNGNLNERLIIDIVKEAGFRIGKLH